MSYLGKNKAIHFFDGLFYHKYVVYFSHQKTDLFLGGLRDGV